MNLVRAKTVELIVDGKPIEVCDASPSSVDRALDEFADVQAIRNGQA